MVVSSWMIYFSYPFSVCKVRWLGPKKICLGYNSCLVFGVSKGVTVCQSYIGAAMRTTFGGMLAGFYMLSIGSRKHLQF